MENYHQISITSVADVESIIAILDKFFKHSGFESREDEVIMYINEIDFTPTLTHEIANQLSLNVGQIKSTFLPYRNYNADWEANFQPVYVEDFCAILAEFHESNHQCEHEITIKPKMAFGTGHHATTYMMINAMKDIDFEDKFVFDFGAGTGILSVMASKLGAKGIVANDIQFEAMDNIQEHVLVNDCKAAFSIIHGGIEDVEAKEYDVILANINTVVLKKDVKEVCVRLSGDGIVLFSGILAEVAEGMIQHFESNDLKLLERWQRGEWVCLKMAKV